MKEGIAETAKAGSPKEKNEQYANTQIMKEMKNNIESLNMLFRIIDRAFFLLAVRAFRLIFTFIQTVYVF